MIELGRFWMLLLPLLWLVLDVANAGASAAAGAARGAAVRWHLLSLLLRTAANAATTAN
jgi:hypothetical protein